MNGTQFQTLLYLQLHAEGTNVIHLYICAALSQVHMSSFQSIPVVPLTLTLNYVLMQDCAMMFCKSDSAAAEVPHLYISLILRYSHANCVH